MFALGGMPTAPYGSVANFAQGGMKGQVALVCRGLGSQGVELFGRSAALVSGLKHQLPFLDHVHEFDTDQRVLGRRKRLESEHGTCHALHTSMILLHNIVEILNLADFVRTMPVCRPASLYRGTAALFRLLSTAPPDV